MLKLSGIIDVQLIMLDGRSTGEARDKIGYLTVKSGNTGIGGTVHVMLPDMYLLFDVTNESNADLQITWKELCEDRL